MMSKNAGNKFSYRSCKFRVQKSKEGTGRVVMWKLGIANSYTMESTFGGSTLGNRKGTHFSTQDLKSLGYHFCDTLLDFCDPDPTKVTACLAELAAMRREARLRLGGGYDASLSDASASDLESSTSGSNSTDSNDLPAHLLNIIDKEISCKKKRLKTRKERTRLRQERALSNKAKISPLALKHNASVVPGEGKTENQVAAVSDSKREKREFHLEAVTATYLHFEGPVDTTPDGRAELEGRACRKFPLRSVSSQPRQPYLHRQLLPSPCGLDHEPNSAARGLPPPHALARRLAHRPKAFQEARVELARVSITFDIPEASSTSTDLMETVRKRRDKEGTAGAVLAKELDSSHGGVGPDSAAIKQATDTDPFLPNLRKQDLSTESRSRRLSPLASAKAGEAAHGFPKVPAAGPAQASDPLFPQRSRLQRLQNLTLAKTTRLPLPSSTENSPADPDRSETAARLGFRNAEERCSVESEHQDHLPILQ
ncbi:hypothetical protein ANANG_G00209970 [Anguilla anguilla]|uniref:Peptidase M14 domain-containing protein n=1 Tax=Anguilla anguilla TaxID=7936 RepID=A0A9D3RR99_ANGAN|nr:hypothetical protein ANANG_G00209970 [Anguilla anguilla]